MFDSVKVYAYVIKIGESYYYDDVSAANDIRHAYLFKDKWRARKKKKALAKKGIPGKVLGLLCIVEDD